MGLFLIADLGAWILAGSTFGPCLSALLGLLETGALSQHGQGLAGAAAVSSQRGLPPCSHCGLSVPTGTPHTRAGRAGFGLSLCLPTDQEHEQCGDTAQLGYRCSPLKGAGLPYVFRRALLAKTVSGQEHTLGKQSLLSHVLKIVTKPHC